jgi:hypothetical protein
LVREILERSPWERLVIDTTEERWAEYERQLASFFGCSLGRERVTVSPEVLLGYVGEYRWPEGAPQAGALRLTLDPAGRLNLATSYRQDMLLVPVSADRFAIQGTPLTVAFDGEALLFTDVDQQVYRCRRVR